MTDAAVPVTQSVLEQFVEQYLRVDSCTIEKRGDTWDVTVPEEATIGLSSGQLRMICSDTKDDGADGELLNPESELCQHILAEASEWAPTGSMSIKAANTTIQFPGWLHESDVEVKETQFTPYYDRTAIVVLFRVNIETVSEYQTESLNVIAVDARSDERLPELEDTFLSLTSVGEAPAISNRIELDAADVQSALEVARNHLDRSVEEKVEEVHEEASRAADKEVEEYREMQEQRIQELEKECSNLSRRIDELSKTITRGEQDERVQALKKRKEMKSKYDELEADLDELRRLRQSGFPERQREIRERHALDVRLTPLTLTQVEYERGEAKFELQDETITGEATFGYGSGVGITDDVVCSSCGQNLTEDNPLRSITDGLRCLNCKSETQLN